MKKKCGIYCIENTINHKKYIGLSRDIMRRWTEHKHELRHNIHDNAYLQHSWNKYSESAFVFYIIEECEEQILDEREQYYILRYKSQSYNHGYNLTSGGENAVTYSKRVIDLHTQEVHPSISAVSRASGKAHHTIANWCNQRRRYMFYDEWCELSQMEREAVMSIDWIARDHDKYSKRTLDSITSNTLKKLSNATKGRNNPRAFMIYCPELDEYFWGAQEAKEKYGVNAGSISMYLNGKLGHAGKHPITGEYLTWVKVMKE